MYNYLTPSRHLNFNNDYICHIELWKGLLSSCLDKFSALMTSSEPGDDADVARDQIQRLLGRTRDREPSRDSKSRIVVDIQLSDVIVVDVVNK